MILRWFISPTVRQACALRSHVERLLAAQRDQLSPQALGAITLALNQLRDVVAAGENIGKIRIKMDELDFAANKWLKPYPNAAWRENVEVILVAVAVAMAIRTFFVQPFKIPTGSMQPTLFGVISKNYLPHDGRPGDPNFKIPTGWERIKEWFEGISYIHVVAERDGRIACGRAAGPIFDFQHQTNPLDWRPVPNDLVSARLRRSKFADAGRVADPRGVWRRAKLSKGPGCGED